jgi:signal transduction histidine kinase
MSSRQSGPGSPRRLLFFFLAVGVVLAAVMLWLGWKLVRQDQDLTAQRLQERRESAADLVVVALQKSLSRIDDRMNRLASLAPAELQKQAAAEAASLPDDCVLILFRPDAAGDFPKRRLPFYPVVRAKPEPPPALFAEAERLEFRQRDSFAAVKALKEPALSPDPQVRAAALLRIARNYRKLGRSDEALAAYGKLGALKDAEIEGLPAGLVALQARLLVLEQTEGIEAVRREAAVLQDGLRERRWMLTRGAYEFYAAEVRRALGNSGQAGRSTDDAKILALASAAEVLYREWRADLPASGYRTLWESNQPLLAVWRHADDRMDLLLLGPQWLKAQLEEGRCSGFARQGIAIVLTDAGGRPVLGREVAGSPRQTIRMSSETQLPWNVHAVTVNPDTELASSRAWSRILFVALGLISTLIIGGAYLVGRAVARDVAVSRLQSEFVSSVSHEFRTPLASLCLLSDLLASGRVAGEADRNAYYAVLVRESRRLRRLVEGLLNFGRMEAGAMAYRFETVDPAELVRELSGDFRQEVGASDFRIDVTTADDTPLVSADRTALGSAIWNLLDNAVKYSPGCRRIWVDVLREDGWAAIRVGDEGLGIPAAEQKRIFEKFTRGEAARRVGIEGTGVGLAMVRRILAAHGGQVRVESEPGRGSTFTLLLPGVS